MAASTTSIDDLEESYKALLLEATLLREEFKALSDCVVLDDEDLLPNLTAISEGRVATAIASRQPISVRQLATTIQEAPEAAQILIAEDFELYVQWLTSKKPPPQLDMVREALVKRRTLLEASLPEFLAQDITSAFTHTERSFLQKRYVNDETMLGDAIADIPRESFFVSEDNYAWDMEELAQAITANDGVMRNPLSKQMFSETDIRFIVAHPHGRRLKALQVAQSELRKGVRLETVERVGELGNVMLSDQSEDAGQARRAVDKFLAFVVTLPDQEQETLRSLKIPAKDTHTGQPYDYTIGDAIADAKANTTCFHKSGDFLAQAAEHLERVGRAPSKSFFRSNA